MNIVNNYAIRNRIKFAIDTLDHSQLPSEDINVFKSIAQKTESYAFIPLYLFSLALADFANAIAVLDVAENQVRRLRSHLLFVPSASGDDLQRLAFNHMTGRCRNAQIEVQAALVTVNYRMYQLGVQNDTCYH